MTNRREFFKSFKQPLQTKKEEPTLRPPYGLSESLFQSECVICEEKFCVTSCDEGIILIKSDGTPTLKFNKSGCTFCEECAISCKSGVLSLEHPLYKEVLNATFQIDFDSCMAHQKTICFACKEPCIDDAIIFNGMFNPVIDSDKCTSCGFCISRCPTNAIEYKPTKLKGEEDES